MKRERIERLAIDCAARELNEDSEVLFKTYLTEHPDANKWALDIWDIYEKTKEAIDAEIMEIVAQEGSQITKKRLRDSSFPHSAIVGAVFRNNSVFIPVGTSQIEPNDKVIVFALPEAISKVEKIFS